jgi:UDP-N-acetylmuramate dehydrogenase
LVKLHNNYVKKAMSQFPNLAQQRPWIKQLQGDLTRFPGVFQFDVSLAKLNTWGVGGCVSCMYAPKSGEALAAFLAWLPEEIPVEMLGLGSNILFADGYLEAVVIHTPRYLRDLAMDDGLLRVGAGVTCAKLARFATQQGFVGAGFFAGIPGTMGGALAMNAGAFGGQTWPWVASVQVVTRRGLVESRDSRVYDYGYRVVNGPDDAVFLGAILQQPNEGAYDARCIEACLLQRKKTQPIGTPNCGSVFRNPPGDFAARLIESCDLKGSRVGFAQVSMKHANFMINVARKATAKDMLALIHLVQTKVYSVHRVWLELEVKVVGAQVASQAQKEGENTLQ